MCAWQNRCMQLIHVSAVLSCSWTCWPAPAGSSKCIFNFHSDSWIEKLSKRLDVQVVTSDRKDYHHGSLWFIMRGTSGGVWWNMDSHWKVLGAWREKPSVCFFQTLKSRRLSTLGVPWVVMNYEANYMVTVRNSSGPEMLEIPTCFWETSEGVVGRQDRREKWGK